jgi:single-strand selective monofunctional uracil DNA glycosylase
VRTLEPLRFGPPVTHVYDPLDYAREPYEEYVRRHGAGPKEAIFLGMNPGPFGMTQTGVPFGEIEAVRGWLGIDGRVRRPKPEHPRRPIEGFACKRSEVSGARLWGLFRDEFGTPERFFSRFLVLNYCPLVFLEESGRNRTPDKLPAAEREPLIAACDEALRRSVELLRPKLVIGVGGFAERRAREALPGQAVGCILHPSPASPAANRDWAGTVRRQLAELGVEMGNKSSAGASKARRKS